MTDCYTPNTAYTHYITLPPYHLPLNAAVLLLVIFGQGAASLLLLGKGPPEQDSNQHKPKAYVLPEFNIAWCHCIEYQAFGCPYTSG